MPTIQSTYDQDIGVAYAGQIADTGPTNIISRQVETAAIGFGKVVQQGAADKGVEAADAATDVVRGITVLSHDDDVTEDNEYPVGKMIPILTQGVIWMKAGANVTAAGVPVYMVVGTAEAGNVTPTSTSNLAIPGAVFDSTGDAGDLVKVRLNN